jgi:hypothetical protein
MEQLNAKCYQARYGGDYNGYFARVNGKWEWDTLEELLADKEGIVEYLSANPIKGCEGWYITETNKLGEDEWEELAEELGVEVETDHSPKVIAEYEECQDDFTEKECSYCDEKACSCDETEWDFRVRVGAIKQDSED